MTDLYTRGYNPIWSEVDLTGNQFDDTFYLFVLENELPYVPANVYHTPNGTVWTQPIQFLANGTLPTDVYFDPNVTYRLEFRQGNTMSDPLIYLIENYKPGGGTVTPQLVTFPTDNQITNPQFSLINFVSPYTQTGASAQNIEVAPGWVLELTGSGNVTLEREAKDSSVSDNTNAPYALNINLSGWTSAILRQRFQQNGVLWANKTVSAAVSARREGAAVEISARLVDSNGTNLGSLLDTTTLTTSFESYTGSINLGASSNPNDPPAAYIDYELVLPTTGDVFVTSFQVIASDTDSFQPAYEQTTVNRQIDHTFNVYRNSLLLESKGDILVGWDFALNPWQTRSTVQSNVATNVYTADQTILIQQAYVDSATGNNVSVGQADFSKNYGLTVQSVTANNQFALVQYIDPVDARPYWDNVLSSYVKLNARKQGSSNLRIKAKLIYRSSLPSNIGQNEPVASWAASGEPVLAAGWSSVTALNDPTYNLIHGENELYFDKFVLPVADNANMTLGIIIYTIDSMIPSGTPDNITFNKINLIPNQYASDSVSLSFNETLIRCQRYYQKSFPVGTVPTTAAGRAGAYFSAQWTGSGIAVSAGPRINFSVPMRATPSGAALYNPVNANNQIYNNAKNTDWGASQILFLSAYGFATDGTTPIGSTVGDFCLVHWVANARLGN